MNTVITRAFRYLYHYLFRFDFLTWSLLRRELGAFAYGQAITGIAASELAYLMAIYFVLKRQFGVTVLPGGGFGIFSLAAVLLALNYVIFGREKKHQEIMREFASEGRTQKIRRGILVWLYLMGSIVAVFAATV